MTDNRAKWARDFDGICFCQRKMRVWLFKEDSSFMFHRMLPIVQTIVYVVRKLLYNVLEYHNSSLL